MEEIKVTVAIENSGNNLETSEEEKLSKAEEERQKKLQYTSLLDHNEVHLIAVLVEIDIHIVFLIPAK